MTQTKNMVHIASLRRGLSERDGGYMWRGKLRLWDNEILTGWYVANDGSIRSKGTMYLLIHADEDEMTGRWVGLGYDDSIMTGWATMGRTEARSRATMSRLIEGAEVTAS
jgi:hypothetical protein